MDFSKEDIRAQVSETLNENFMLGNFKHYGPNDFESPSSEESLYLVSGAKSKYSNLIKFWIKGFQKIINFERRHEGESDYLKWYETNIWEIEGSKFHRELKSMTSRLKKDIDLLESPNKYYQVRDEWNEQIFIIENESELMMVYWDTTA